jgi:hypothetical protein
MEADMTGRPKGDHALSGAERQAAFRRRRHAHITGLLSAAHGRTLEAEAKALEAEAILLAKGVPTPDIKPDAETEANIAKRREAEEAQKLADIILACRLLDANPSWGKLAFYQSVPYRGVGGQSYWRRLYEAIRAEPQS